MSTLPRHEAKDRWVHILTVTWSLVGIGILVAAAGWMLGKVSAALVPFLLAVIIVFMFRSPVAYFERSKPLKCVPRSMAMRFEARRA